MNTWTCDCYHAPEEHNTRGCNILGCPCMKSRASYDTSIHCNPDAQAWTKFFLETWAKVYPDRPAPEEGWMHGWFANAMMAMADHLKNEERKNKGATETSEEVTSKLQPQPFLRLVPPVTEAVDVGVEDTPSEVADAVCGCCGGTVRVLPELWCEGCGTYVCSMAECAADSAVLAQPHHGWQHKPCEIANCDESVHDRHMEKCLKHLELGDYRP